MRLPVAGALLGLLITSTSVFAQQQQPFNVAVQVTELSRIFTDLYGPSGLVVNSNTTLASGATHSAHFNSGFESEFSQFGTALTSQIVSLPLPPPASGFTYQFDPALGVFTRTTSTFGPILSERAETIGLHRVAVGFAVQGLSFDSIEGIDLNAVPAVFTHDDAQLLGGREDVVSTLNSIEARVTRSAGFVSYGVTNHLDVSVVVPIVSTDLIVTSDAQVRRIGTTNPETHFFRASDDEIGDRRIFTAFGESSGLGDVTIRFKQNVHRQEKYGAAFGVDIRLPTGDEANLLGTGAPGIQPFGVWSGSFGVVSPHVNLGYQWNGSSVLASSPGSGVAEDLPDVVAYSLGGVLAVHPKLTAAVDLIGRYVIDSPRLRSETFHALDGRTELPNIAFGTGSFNELSAALGVKLNLVGPLLLNMNVLMRLNSVGLRDKISPFIGVEYAF
jgi:hypothetical protein